MMPRFHSFVIAGLLACAGLATSSCGSSSPPAGAGGQGGAGGAGGGDTGGAGGAGDGGGGASAGGGGAGGGQGGGAGQGGGEPGPEASELLRGLDEASAPLRAVGRLRGGLGSGACTAFLIDPSGRPDAPAHVLTNAHCTHEWAVEAAANAVYVDTAANPELQMIFNYFSDTEGAQVVVPAKTIRYATMKGTDLAVVELDATVGALAERGVVALELAPSAPPPGARVSVVGAPQLDVEFLRRARCSEEGTFDVVELRWHWFDAHRNRCADIANGSSGSPVLDDAQRVYAVVNTTTLGSPPDGDCYLGRPCEIDAPPGVSAEGASYAVDVTGVGACFADDGRFALDREGCPLDAGRALDVLTYPAPRERPSDPTTGATNTWGVTLGARDALGFFRYKIGRAGEVDCRRQEGYSAPFKLDAQDLSDLPLPELEAVHLLCVVAGPTSTPDASWQPLASPTVVLTTIDTTPPTRRPELSRGGDAVEGMRVEPIFSLPEHADFEYRFGPPETTDCGDPTAAWRRYIRIPIFLDPRELPARFCVRPTDWVGNVGEPFDYLLPD
ncbi:trypsin-like serine peptidase [Sorangium sp. So ce1024]|uniref:trypsin-like serine peptidase n=1 Tax=Sorangium sp. So ce1024 TaxID=3133327 RepID=UPI003F120270